MLMLMFLCTIITRLCFRLKIQTDLDIDVLYWLKVEFCLSWSLKTTQKRVWYQTNILKDFNIEIITVELVNDKEMSAVN